jgi:hypothetical protein
LTLPTFVVGFPSDEVGIAAFALGLVALSAGALFYEPCRKLAGRVPAHVFAIGAAVTAAALSAGYVAYYLRGGPRIVDATSYFLEARALAQGNLAFEVPEPSGSFRGRFLVSAPDGRLAVLFPPGYALVLSLGFLAGAPLVIGPLLGALLAALTYGAARALFQREDVARTAALLSVLCATLRYHTADTMSHGLSALLLTGTLVCAARATSVSAVAAGLAAGLLVATRPVTAMVALLLGAWLSARGRPARVLAFAAGVVPGVLLLALHQHAATGSFFSSTQLHYYALSDTPPGCFRYGFGQGIGCLHEHGDFVRANLAHGYDFSAALRTTLRRLAQHVFDITNFAPLAVLVPVVVVRHYRDRGVRVLGLAVAGVIAAYAPFYFDGNYPGGGARFYADALPLEHLLVALGLVELKLARFVPAFALLGFAFNTVNAHVALRDREGGRPMFDAAELAARGVQRGLVFVDTDHGFSLGHDPGVRDPQKGMLVARYRGDAHDLALFNALGRPDTYLYRYSARQGRTTLERYLPSSASLRFELESQWPPLEVARGSAYPTYAGCLSRGAGLRLKPDATGQATATIELSPPGADEYLLKIGWLADPETRLRVKVGAGAIVEVNSASGCSRAPLGTARLDGTVRVDLAADGPSPIIDYIELEEADSKRR